VRGVVSKSFILFRDFTRGELDEDPLELLGEKAWLLMTGISEVFEKERQECIYAITAHSWTADALQEAALKTSCKECGSLLIEPKNHENAPDIECRSCGSVQYFEEFAEHAMSEGIDHHFNYLDGGDAIVINCPHCGLDAYHYESGKCVACGESAPHDCLRCSNGIPPEEVDGGSFCSYCSNLYSKDD